MWSAFIVLGAFVGLAQGQVTEPNTHVVPDIAQVQTKVGSGEPVVIAANEKVANVVSFNGPVAIHGTVTGDAVVMGSDLTIHGGGQVGGDAVVFGGAIEIEPQGHLAGNQVALKNQPSSPLMSSILAVPALEQTGATIGVNPTLIRKLSAWLGLGGFGIFVLGGWPRRVGAVGRVWVQQPIWYAIGGAILAGLLTLTILVSLLTLIGSPLGLVILVAIFLALALAFSAACVSIGARILRRPSGETWIEYLVGFGVFVALAQIPYFGSAMVGLLLLSSWSAAMLSRLGNDSAARPGLPLQS